MIQILHAGFQMPVWLCSDWMEWLLIHSRTVGSWAVHFTDLILDVWEVQMSFDTQRLWNLASQSNGWYDRWLWSRACEKKAALTTSDVLLVFCMSWCWKETTLDEKQTFTACLCHLKSKSNHRSWTANIYLWQASLFGSSHELFGSSHSFVNHSFGSAMLRNRLSFMCFGSGVAWSLAVSFPIHGAHFLGHLGHLWIAHWLLQ